MVAVTVEPSELHSFATNLLVESGIPRLHATVVADHMVWADTHGRPNYGTWRLPILCRRADAGLFGSVDATIETVSAATAIVDGKNAIGHYVATLASDAACDMAERAGAGIVFVRSSNFVGALGYYTARIAERNMVGVMVSNAHPRVAAHGGTRPVLGTNPLAFAAPRPDDAPIIVDMALSAVAGSRITKSIETGSPLPVGIAVEYDGTPITDASRVGQGAVLPMAEAKGFGLALMVEILAGVVSGAGVSHGVHSMYKDFENPGDSGHTIIAIDLDPLIGSDRYAERITDLQARLIDSGDVRMPGDARETARVESVRRGGAALDDTTVTALDELAVRYRVDTPWAKSETLREGEDHDAP